MFVDMEILQFTALFANFLVFCPFGILFYGPLLPSSALFFWFDDFRSKEINVLRFYDSTTQQF